MNYIVIIIFVGAVVAVFALILHIVTTGTANIFKSSGQALDSKYQNDQQKFRCPHCGQFTISAIEKKNLSSSSSVACPNCGTLLTTPWWSKFVMGLVTFSPLFLVLPFVGLNYFILILLIPGAYLAMAFKIRYVPLVEK